MPEISEEELNALKAKAEEADSLASTKRRLEDENSKIKTRAKEAEDKVSVAEKAKLTAEGKTQELLDIERAERAKSEEKYTGLKKVTLHEKLRTEVTKHAKNAHSVDMLLKVSEHKGLLKLDEENLTVDGAEEFVKACQESHSYMFAKDSLDVGDNRPPKGDKTDFSTDSEKYLSELQACNTRTELEAVKKKYGKE